MARTDVIPPLSASQQFRADAGDLMSEAAGMTLHQLVDEFERLTEVMSENTSKNKDGQYPEFVTAEPGELARRQRNLINGALRARFGLSLDTWDRDLPGEGNF